MRRMFESATLKLTGWYLLILMTISILFSVIIFQISSSELKSRFDTLNSQFDTSALSHSTSVHELDKANINLFIGLFYANIVILIIGGVGSYFAARKTLEPIEAAHEAQSRFTSDASHELRTPLAVMKSELEVALRSKSLAKHDMRELLESNLEEVNRLTELSHTLLQLSRHEFTDLPMGSVDLTEIIKSTVKVLNLSKTRISISLPRKHITVTANTSSLRELILIILDNAQRYSPSDSQIRLSASENNSQVQIKVSNQGEGIDPNDLPHIFERFYRADSSRSGTESGFGLGLSLAKNIIDLHDGKLSIASEPGKQTTATITLPKTT